MPTHLPPSPSAHAGAGLLGRPWSLRTRLILLVLACILPIILVGGLFIAGMAQHLLDMHAERMDLMLEDANHRLHDAGAQPGGPAIPPARLLAALAEASAPERGGFVLTGPDGTVIATTLPAPLAVLPALLRGAAPAPAVHPVTAPDGHRYSVLLARSSAAAPLSLSIWEPADTRAAAWKQPVLRYIVLMLLALLVALAAAAIMAIRLVRPLTGLTEHALAVARGQDGNAVPVPTSRVTEFETLRVALADAALALRRRAATERRAMHDAQDGQILLASVIAASADGITVKALDGRYLLANRAAAGIMGLSEPHAALVGRTAREFLDPQTAARIERLDQEVIATGATRSNESHWPQAAPDGRHVLVLKSPWRDTAGTTTGVVTVMRDVTRQRQDEARLHAAQSELARASRLSAMGVMASGLAHDLNQPLAAAANFLGAARRLLARAPAASPAAPPAAIDALDEAVAQVLRAGGIVNALRGFLQGGHVSLAPTDLAALVQEACAITRADGTLGSARLTIDLPPDLPIVMADRTQLQQVIVNLIRNAAEALATHTGAPGEIRIRATPHSTGVGIAVADTGPGLDAAIADRLFQPFVSTKPDGLGIGLAICHAIVDAHGGRLSGATAPTGGAVFTIDLPLPSNSPDTAA